MTEHILHSKLSHIDDGITFEKYAGMVANEVSLDAVPFWHIVPVGRQSYGLTGDDLICFVRCCLLAMFRRGAKPCVAGPAGREGIYPWNLKDTYGATPETMADAVIAEWLASGVDPKPNSHSLWFALPDMIAT
jgi:hypothetical protein